MIEELESYGSRGKLSGLVRGGNTSLCDGACSRVPAAWPLCSCRLPQLCVWPFRLSRSCWCILLLSVLSNPAPLPASLGVSHDDMLGLTCRSGASRGGAGVGGPRVQGAPACGRCVRHQGAGHLRRGVEAVRRRHWWGVVLCLAPLNLSPGLDCASWPTACSRTGGGGGGGGGMCTHAAGLTPCSAATQSPRGLP